MVNISKMARAAGIGSAVGATIGGIKEARDKDGDVLGGIVGGAIVGSIGGAGISAGRQYLQAKRLANAAGSDIADAVTKQAATPRASQPQQSVQSNVINNAQDLNVAKNVMNFKVGDSSISISKLSDPNSLSGSQIKELAHMDAINYRSQLRGIDNLSEKDMQNATNIASLKLSSQFNDVDMQRKYQNYFHEGIEDSIARESKYATKQAPIQGNNTQNGTIEKLIDDYYGPGTSADKYVRNNLNKSFTETKRFRKWHIDDPYSDGEIGTDLEIRQRKSNGVFEIKQHSFFVDDPEYYSKPSEWIPYKFN